MPRGVPTPDLTGQKFGKLSVIKRADIPTDSGKFWECLCNCGETVNVVSSYLTKGIKSSCNSCTSRKPMNKDYSGRTFGQFTVLCDVGSNGKERVYSCECKCGNTVDIPASKLRGMNGRGNKPHCGCLDGETIKVKKEKSTTHGMSGSPTYTTWSNMIQRCINPDRWDFKHYGGRGIRFDPRWKDFKEFYSDMGTKPEGMSLERMKADEGYSKDNCIWADETTQNYHQRNRSDNTSGTPGVTYHSENNMWIARLWKDKKVVHYSYHETYRDAVDARKAAELEHYGYEKNR